MPQNGLSTQSLEVGAFLTALFLPLNSLEEGKNVICVLHCARPLTDSSRYPGAWTAVDRGIDSPKTRWLARTPGP